MHNLSSFYLKNDINFTNIPIKYFGNLLWDISWKTLEFPP